ncbi:Synaptogyrin-1 [Dissostichus eleginoides]|uniref:Synaptogyrin-1 n=1 Tax=Dissostichus eleginoides TaxID=100907 RepID=A0AAD9BLU3_DISEL|nr:Synaptogyrin-1 [Dissostichus eleginoides]
MEGMQAYGAGKAGGAFDPVTFFQQPQTILRIVSWIFSIVIFGCIANEGYINRPDTAEEFCIFNKNQNACNYGVFMGSMAFLCCLAFLALDVYFPQISSVKDRKKAVLADIGLSAFWSFMWFVGFCFLANQWQVTNHEDNPLREGVCLSINYRKRKCSPSSPGLVSPSWASRDTNWAPTRLYSPRNTQTPARTQRGGRTPPSGGGRTWRAPSEEEEGGGAANSEAAFDGSGGYQRQDY